MEETKIQLSEEEMRLMQEEEWILTKNRVIEKIVSGFARLAAEMRAELRACKGLHPALAAVVEGLPKVARGEKYRSLPYVMLDYPRIFEKDDILAFRTFFWWGNFCSITIHVKGRYSALVSAALTQSLPLFQEAACLICAGGDEWDHDAGGGEYRSLSGKRDDELQHLLSSAPFIKITGLVRLGQWADMERKLNGFFRLFTGLLCQPVNFQCDEKDPSVENPKAGSGL